MKNTKFVTIASANYLAYARVLAKSLNDVGHGELEILVVDRKSDSLNALLIESGLKFRFAEELKIRDFERLAYKYDVVEFNTALKPTYLKKILDEGADQVVYLDPDILVFHYLDPVITALKSSEIVLTPHAMKPAMDGLRPSDVDYLRTGTFNLGFIALAKGPDSSGLLDWWESRCLGLGFNDPTFGIFVDQKWLDLAPCYFKSVTILRNSGCNVAYWNLHERLLTSTGLDILVNNDPLHFFHFSGVKADLPDILSKHQTRHKLEDNSILKRLVGDYCKLLNNNMHRKYSALNYTFGYLSNGKTISQEMRRALTAYPGDELSPFDSKSTFQKFIKKSKITSHQTGPRALNTMNFNKGDLRLRAVNIFIKLLVHIFGTSRVSLLLKYFAFVSRESNLSRILMDVDFDFRHVPRR